LALLAHAALMISSGRYTTGFRFTSVIQPQADGARGRLRTPKSSVLHPGAERTLGCAKAGYAQPHLASAALWCGHRACSNGAGLIVVDELTYQALSPRLKMDMKGVGALGGRPPEYEDPSRLISVPPSCVNGNSSFDCIERVRTGCERPGASGWLIGGSWSGGVMAPSLTQISRMIRTL
jgi:hypothetical protein